MIHCTRTHYILTCLILLGTATVRAQDWPQWRGANRDNHVVGFTAPKTWPKELTQKWRVTVGLGESSPLLVGDKLYVFGRIGGDEVATCLDAITGKEIWTNKQPSAAITGAASPHQGPRSTPVVVDGKMCTLGVRGAVTCLDAATGKLAWRKENKNVPQFYTSTSPMIVDGKCIVYVDNLTAFDLASGDEKWQWKDGATPYGSPNVMTVDGVKLVVTPYAGGLAVVGAADGKLHWQTKVPGSYHANYSTPLVQGSTFLYSASGGKGGGGNTYAYQVAKKGDAIAVTELWKQPFGAHYYHAPVLKDNLLVGVSGGRTFFGVDAKTGMELWKDGKQRGQCGSILDAGSVFLALSSDSKLVAFKADAKAYTELATYTVSDEETWSVPIVVGNRVYVKTKGVAEKGGKGKGANYTGGTLTMWTIE